MIGDAREPDADVVETAASGHSDRHGVDGSSDAVELVGGLAWWRRSAAVTRVPERERATTFA